MGLYNIKKIYINLDAWFLCYEQICGNNLELAKNQKNYVIFRYWNTKYFRFLGLGPKFEPKKFWVFRIENLEKLIFLYNIRFVSTS